MQQFIFLNFIASNANQKIFVVFYIFLTISKIKNFLLQSEEFRFLNNEIARPKSGILDINSPQIK